jgi:hypothetical protein
LGAVSGCVIYPFSTEVASPAKGVVRDAKTHQPVIGARVSGARGGYGASTRTNEDGMFSVPALKQWHFMAYLGDPGIVPEPWFFRRRPPYSYVLSVQAPGYSPASVTSPMESPREDRISESFVVELKRP